MEPLRLLIADDEPIIRLDLRRTLENMGHIVIGEAGDGAQAVEQSRELKPDLAILDIKMPNMDGIDAAKIISTEGPVLLKKHLNRPRFQKRRHLLRRRRGNS